jgi:hypothetical protein
MNISISSPPLKKPERYFLFKMNVALVWSVSNNDFVLKSARNTSPRAGRARMSSAKEAAGARDYNIDYPIDP